MEIDKALLLRCVILYFFSHLLENGKVFRISSRACSSCGENSVVVMMMAWHGAELRKQKTLNSRKHHKIREIVFPSSSPTNLMTVVAFFARLVADKVLKLLT